MASPTDSVQNKNQQVHYILLAVAVLACLLPFSGKAFNVSLISLGRSRSTRWIPTALE
jgi:hypothetical protein